jgi:hypothetical protein
MLFARIAILFRTFLAIFTYIFVPIVRVQMNANQFMECFSVVLVKGRFGISLEPVIR